MKEHYSHKSFEAVKGKDHYPDVLIIPNGKTNQDIPSVTAGFLAAHWQIPVVDFNTIPGDEKQRLGSAHSRWGIVGPSRIDREAVRLAQTSPSQGSAIWESANGPIDVQCCYPLYRSERPFVWDASFDDDLPFPDYDRFDSIGLFQANWQTGKWYYPVMTSLGCPFGCAYCASRRRNPVFRSVGHCIAELKAAQKKWGIRRFVVIDDCLNAEPSHTREFAKAITGGGLEWMAGNGLRADRFDPELGRLMRRAGCRWVAFGVETIDNRILKTIQKGERFDQMNRAVTAALDIFDYVSVFLILGLPGSSQKSDQQSIAWAKSKGVHIHVSFFVPPAPTGDIPHIFDSPDSRPLPATYAPAQQLALYRWATQ